MEDVEFKKMNTFHTYKKEGEIEGQQIVYFLRKSAELQLRRQAGHKKAYIILFGSKFRVVGLRGHADIN